MWGQDFLEVYSHAVLAMTLSSVQGMAVSPPGV